jgi:Rrf2 family protein
VLAIYSDSCKHAIRALVYLARLEPGERSTVQEILEDEDFPEAALAKVLQRLASRGILDSAKGPGGGFRLARPAEKLRLSEVMHAVDGQDRVEACALGMSECTEEAWCPIHDHWFRAKEALSDMLRTTSIADLAREVRPASKGGGKSAKSGDSPRGTEGRGPGENRKGDRT